MGNLLAGIGQARPVSDFINTVGQYQQVQSNLETQRMQQQKLQAEALQAEKDNREYDIDGALSLYPEHTRPIIGKALKMGGFVSPEGIVRGKDMRGVPDLLKKTGLHINMYQADIDALKSENEKLGKKTDDESRQKALSNASEIANLKRLINKELGGETEKGFTLGEGQKRFDASGQEIAAGTPKSEKVWSEPTKMVIDGKTVMVQTSNTGEMKTVAQGSSPAVTINFDKDVIKQQIKELPKLKEKARSSSNALKRIDQMLGLLDRGAGGRLGQAKAWIAPYAEAFGFNSKGMTEATLYERLARTQGGSMRLEVIGPGQVSDYEGRLMREISGGGETAASAARELLVYYRGLAEGNINDYNTAAGSVGDVSPTSKKANPPMGVGTPPEKKRYRFNPATGQLE